MSRSPRARYIPVLGTKIGRRTIIGLSERRSGNHAYVLCRCDCGDESEVVFTRLLRGRQTRCLACANKGLGHPEAHPDRAQFRETSRRPVVGERFGKRVVVALLDIRFGHHHYVLCRCDCGRENPVSYKDLIRGIAHTCLHCRPEQPTKPIIRVNGKLTVEYMTWNRIRARCTNPRTGYWHRYGGRGIYVAPEWDTFEAFLADMGPRPSDQHSIERVDNDGPYAPWNCVWATREVQSRNRCTSHLVTHQGRTLTVAEWAREAGVLPSTVRWRLEMGWSIEEALAPTDKHRHRHFKKSPTSP